jgi:formate dehydrogenase subunit delta
MANQIAANFEYGPDQNKAAAGVFDHLSRFWTPSMRAQIVDHYRQGETELSEVAALAVAKLAEHQENAA